MKLRSTILALSMLMCAQAFAMEAPPQKPSERGVSLLLDLPTDIKGYLLPFVLQGNQIEMEKAIFTMASTSTHFNKSVNNPQVMLSILNAVAEKSPYVAHAVTLAERLQTKEKTLPVMKDSLIIAWIVKTRASMQNGKELFEAVILNDKRLVRKYLANNKIDLNFRASDEYLRTPLTRAIFTGGAKIAKNLLLVGADVRIVDRDGRTPLMTISRQTHTQSIINLIKAGAKINATDNFGHSALMYAATNNRGDILYQLLENGADTATTGICGMTPREMAVRCCHYDVVAMFDVWVKEKQTLKQKQRVKLCI